VTAEATGFGYYERAGRGYADRRRPDPRIAAAIVRALGDARTVVNVGAGAGSYEPVGRDVVAVEPSAVMLGQRSNRASCVRGVAEALPFAHDTFDAAMAVLTIHHWSDWRRGLAEMQRVARRTVVLTYDTAEGSRLWLFDYFPVMLARDRERMPELDAVREALGGDIVPVPVPHDCTDGFLGAYWREPSAYFDENVRSRMSGFAMLAPAEVQEGLAALAADLRSGAWAARYGHLLGEQEIDLGYRLVASRV